jgi:hypothetical protein
MTLPNETGAEATKGTKGAKRFVGFLFVPFVPFVASPFGWGSAVGQSPETAQSIYDDLNPFDILPAISCR